MPEEIVGQLMAEIRKLFYQGAPFKRWAQDTRLLIRLVVLWPATWFDSRGLLVAPARYREILTRIFVEAREHLRGEIRFVPAYLAKCVQAYFKRHEDQLHDEAKALRPALERALRDAGAARRLAIDPLPALLAARKALQPARRKAAAGLNERQAELFSSVSQTSRRSGGVS